MKADMAGKLQNEEYPNSVPHDVEVSVCMVTYNQEKYIGQAIEGVLMQRTNFRFELCIGEDDSSDRTREICLEYARKYPQVIRLFLRDRKDVEYIDGQPTARSNGRKTRRSCRGKYISMCEGDDYWIDPGKLQKQYERMESNRDLSMCFHSTCVEDARTGERYKDSCVHGKKNRIVSLGEILMGGGGFCPTNSLFFRSDILHEMPPFMVDCPVGDASIQLLMGMSGSVEYINESMSVYRKNVSGSWSSRIGTNVELRIKHLSRIIRFYRQLDQYLNNRYHLKIMRKISRNLIKIGAACGIQNVRIRKFLSTINNTFPDSVNFRILLISGFFLGLIRRLTKRNA